MLKPHPDVSQNSALGAKRKTKCEGFTRVGLHRVEKRADFNVVFLCLCLGGYPFSTSPCPYFTLYSSSTKYVSQGII